MLLHAYKAAGSGAAFDTRTKRVVLRAAATALLLFAFLSTFWLAAAQAEDSTTPILDSSSLGQPSGECRLFGGMAEREIHQCFGAPDEITVEKARQVYHYGDCELYVAEQKLIAWLNADELGDRRRLASLARRSDKDYDPTDKAHWVNEWTPRKEVLPQEELLDLVGDENDPQAN